MLIRVVTGFLNAMTYNSQGFDNNSIPKGLLHMSGDYSQEDLTAFRRYWNATVKGVNNAWALPVMISKDQESKASFETFGAEFNEMHFSKWMQFLCSLVCAIYGMEPSEINFESFSTQKSSLSGDDTAERQEEAKDRGLRPFMSFYESVLTDFIIQDWSDRYCFRFAGMEQDDPKEEFEAQKLILTVNEMRAERGYEKYPVEGDEPDLGSAPLNPALMGVWQQAVAPPPGAEFGGEGGQTEDFGSVPGEDTKPQPPGGAAPGGAGKPPSAGGGGDFGKGGAVAKAFIIG
jgi:hypothetical protein